MLQGIFHDGSPGLAARLALLAILASRTAGAEDPVEKAKEHFDKGVLLFKNQYFDEALLEFRAAYEAKPHATVRYNIGITLYKLKRHVEAFEELEAYILQVGDEVPDERRIEVIQIMKEIGSLVGTLEVVCDVQGAVLEVDGKTSASWKVKLEAGDHEIEVTATGHEPEKRKVSLPGGEVISLEVDLVPIAGPTHRPEKRRKPGKIEPAAFWATLGITAALGAGLAVTGGLALWNHSRYEGMTYDDPWESARRTGLRLNIAADVLAGLTGAAAVAAIVLALLTDFRGKEARASLVVSPLGGSLVVGMRWRL